MNVHLINNGPTTLIIESKNIKSTCRLLKDSSELNFNYLECISLVDYEEKLEAVYHLTSFKLKWSLYFGNPPTIQ